MVRICIFVTDLSLPFDEGIKKFSFMFIKTLFRQKGINSLILSRFGRGDERFPVNETTVKKHLLSSQLKREIRKFNPHAIFYFPSSSITFTSIVRSKILKFYGKGCKTVIFGLQPRKYPVWGRFLLSYLSPDVICVQSSDFGGNLSKYFSPCKIKLVSSGVDLERFKPVSKEEKRTLRKKYGISEDVYIILHVGHLTEGRNLGLFTMLQGKNNMEVIIVGSSSTAYSKKVIQELQKSEVKIFHYYIEKIEELYQLSDCYIFPVKSSTASISCPLSILEAMACNLRVITTKYGLISEIFPEKNGVIYFNPADEDLCAKIDLIRNLSLNKLTRTRELVKEFSWESVVQKILKEIF